MQASKCIVILTLAWPEFGQIQPADQWSALSAKATEAYNRGAYAESARLLFLRPVSGGKVRP